jgi:alpha-N-arabinofuranosidase
MSQPGFSLISLMARRSVFLLVSLGASTMAFGQANLPLYLNTLENTFQNWSWIPNNFADTTYVLPGFSSSISATANGDWQAISLGSDVVNAYQGLNLAPYQNLVFWANGGAAGGQKIQVFTGNFDGTGIGATYSLPALTAGTWTQFTVPLSTICPAGTTNIDRLTFQLTPNGTTGTWYLADIYLTARPAPYLVNLSVDASQTIRAADPRWFGVNTAIYDGYLDTSYTSNALAQAGLLSLRFPGGSESDDYNWSTGTSDANTWTWGTSFANLAHVATNAGTQVITTVNYGTGSSNEAAAWVAYANGSPASTLSLGTDQYGTNWHTVGYWASLRAAAPLGSDDGHNFLRISRSAPLGFKYWEVGNECYGSWETDSNAVPHDPFTYATRARDYLNLMKAVDPTIKVGVVATTG